MRPENASGPQTALSDGFGLALHDFADVVDVASLAAARRRHMRRQAMDAVDHLIALLDALDADGEDREPDADGGDADDCDAEDDGSAEPSLGAPERHPDPAWCWARHCRDCSVEARQTEWAAGGTADREVEDEHDEDTFDREEEHDGREPDTDAEEDTPGEQDYRDHVPYVADYFRSGLAHLV